MTNFVHVVINGVVIHPTIFEKQRGIQFAGCLNFAGIGSFAISEQSACVGIDSLQLVADGQCLVLGDLGVALFCPNADYVYPNVGLLRLANALASCQRQTTKHRAIGSPIRRRLSV